MGSKSRRNFDNAMMDNPVDSVMVDPFDDIIGTRMEVQLSGIIADLLLKTHSILGFASNEVISRHLSFLEAYFSPYLKEEEQKRIDKLDEDIRLELLNTHPVNRKGKAALLYNNYIEKKLKILMQVAYAQDMIPGRIKNMTKL